MSVGEMHTCSITTQHLNQSARLVYIFGACFVKGCRIYLTFTKLAMQIAIRPICHGNNLSVAKVTSVNAMPFRFDALIKSLRDF